MLATGGGTGPPSVKNPKVRWIFSSSLTEQELGALRGKPVAHPLPRLAIVCRQERGKGTGTVIESLPLIARDFPDVTLDVVGNGLALNEFRGLAKSLAVEDRICFHGNVEHREVLRLLRQASLFCFPTQASEGFPKAVLEALACGLPVITTPVSVLPQLLACGGGVLLERAAPAELAAAVKRCLSDPQGYARMSERAAETARQYSLERWRDALAEFMRTAWGEHAVRN
jgi:glycosyltransferase involved in cell wall biosynthesis